MTRIKKTLQFLFVEDDSVIRQLAYLMFQSEGMEVTVAKDGQEALSCFRSQPEKFDVIITDLMMPHMDGNELSICIKKIAPHIPVIMCTGTPFAEIGQHRADVLVEKPYDFQKLLKLILLSMRRDEKENQVYHLSNRTSDDNSSSPDEAA